MSKESDYVQPDKITEMVQKAQSDLQAKRQIMDSMNTILNDEELRDGDRSKKNGQFIQGNMAGFATHKANIRKGIHRMAKESKKAGGTGKVDSKDFTEVLHNAVTERDIQLVYKNLCKLARSKTNVRVATQAAKILFDFVITKPKTEIDAKITSVEEHAKAVRKVLDASLGLGVEESIDETGGEAVEMDEDLDADET